MIKKPTQINKCQVILVYIDAKMSGTGERDTDKAFFFIH